MASYIQFFPFFFFCEMKNVSNMSFFLLIDFLSLHLKPNVQYIVFNFFVRYNWAILICSLVKPEYKKQALKNECVLIVSVWLIWMSESDMFWKRNHFQKFGNCFCGYIFTTSKIKHTSFELGSENRSKNIVKPLFFVIAM